jgi:hypothetical protein
MKITIPAALLLIVFVCPAPAHARQQRADARAPWLGCWQLIDENQRRSASGVSICVTPANEPAGMTLKTLVSNQPALEQTIVADAVDHSITDADCRGTQRAEWARASTRLFARAQLVCGGRPRTVSSFGVIAGSGIWIDVQVVDDSGRESVRVRRYRRAPGQAGAPIWQFGTPLTVDDVKEASGKVSPRALEAALVAANARFDLNSRRLIDLDDAGVPDTVIDLMVALSYPRRFVVERATGGGSGSSFAPGGSYFGSWSAANAYPPYFYDPLVDPYGAYYPYSANYYSPFGYSYGGRDGLQYVPGFGFVTADGGGSVTSVPDNGGRAINGVGYVRVRPREASADDTTGRVRQSGDSSTGNASTAGSDSSSSRGSSDSSSGSYGGATSGGFTSGSSSSDTGRTAEPR